MSQPPGACRKTHEYELGDRLGGGSFGDVFAAAHVPSGRHVAVKRVFERPAERGVERPDPARELRVLESLSHPNVIPLLDHYVGRDGAQMLVFPLLGGGTLADVLRGAGTGLGEAAAKGFAKQLLSALAYLHDDAGVVHRDLKCSNFLLGDGGRLYVSDFGQARWLPGAADATVAGAAAPTAPAAAAVRARDATRPMTPHTGTRWLRAPEVLFGSRSYAAAADVWAVGCIVVELLEGVSPFRAEADIAQLASLATKLGFPDEAEWPELGALPDGDKDATRAISLIQRPEAAGELFGWDWAEDAVGGEDSEDGVDDAFGGQGLWTLPLSSVALAALGWDT